MRTDLEILIYYLEILQKNESCNFESIEKVKREIEKRVITPQ